MGISPIQAVNLFRTQPVNFQEAKRTQQYQQPTLGSFNTAKFNLNHPAAADSTPYGNSPLAKHLDLLA